MLIPINEVVHIKDPLTHDPTTGAVSDADSAPTFDVFEEATDTPIIIAQTMTKRTSKTGNYRGSFTASLANGFEAGKWYNVIVTAIVGGITAKANQMHFRVAPIEVTDGVPNVNAYRWNDLPTVALPLVPTTAGRTLDVSATGEAGVDWANVGTPGASVALSFTSIGTATTVGTAGVSSIADGVWDEPTSGHTSVGSYGDKLGAHIKAVLKVIVGSGSTTTDIVLDPTTGIDGTTPSTTDDFYNGRMIVFTSGALAGQATDITDYVGSTGTLTVTALTSGPVAAVTAVIV